VRGMALCVCARHAIHFFPSPRPLSPGGEGRTNHQRRAADMPVILQAPNLPA
jgi:hypothetical protein